MQPHETLNPYAAPAADVAADPARRTESWKAIAWRWEKLRVLYNIGVGLAGVPALLATPLTVQHVFAALVGVVAYGTAANVFYLLGPIAEMYLNWLADLGEGRWLPRGIVRFIRSRWPLILIWLLGTIGSMVLTLFIGVAYAFSLTIPFQD